MDHLVAAVLGCLAALAGGSMLRLALLGRIRDRTVARERLASLGSWWAVALLVGGAALLGRAAAVLLFAAVSGLALREFLRLRSSGSSAWDAGAAYLLLGVHYGLVWLGLRGGMEVFLPLAGLLWVSGRLAVGREDPTSLGAAAELFWGMLLVGWGLSHAVWFFALPGWGGGPAGPAGWFVLLVVLAQGSDIAQALVGRGFGRTRLSPRLSPHKTWEGLVGGVATAIVLGALAGPYLTPVGRGWGAVAGALVVPAGVAGDLTVSALKRRAGVKDSGRALPGQGGVLDRVDSLVLSAPLFFWLALLFR